MHPSLAVALRRWHRATRVVAGIGLLVGAEAARPVLLSQVGLAWSAVISGRVHDGAGQPVNNADFDVFDLFGNKLLFDASTRTTGKYDLTVDPGRYDLKCEPPVGSGLAPQRINGVVVVDALELDWTLPPAVRQLGRVLGPGDRPLAQASLDFDNVVTGIRQPATGDLTSPFGTFAALIEAGTYRLTITPGAADTALAPTRLAPRAVAGLDTIVAFLAPAAHLLGTLRDGSGLPVAGGRLSFDHFPDGLRQPALFREVGPDGFFRCAVEPGEYRVVFEPPSGTRLVAMRTPPITIAGDTPFDMALASGYEVTGTLSDLFGAPVAGADLDVVDEVTGTSEVTPDDNTDLSGSFRLVLPAGRFRVRATTQGVSDPDTLELTGVSITRDTTLALRFGSGGTPLGPRIQLLTLGNPSYRRARFALSLPSARSGRIEVFSPSGRAIRTLASGTLQAGVTTLDWDGRDTHGNIARAGLYFVRVLTRTESTVGRVILLP